MISCERKFLNQNQKYVLATFLLLFSIMKWYLNDFLRTKIFKPKPKKSCIALKGSMSHLIFAYPKMQKWQTWWCPKRGIFWSFFRLFAVYGNEVFGETEKNHKRLRSLGLEKTYLGYCGVSRFIACSPPVPAERELTVWGDFLYYFPPPIFPSLRRIHLKSLPLPPSPPPLLTPSFNLAGNFPSPLWTSSLNIALF